MVSWSIPKGLTLDSSVKRLAMPTSDYALEYRKFEGVLPKGYGAGVVMIWDEGSFNPELELAKGSREEIEERSRGTNDGGLAQRGKREVQIIRKKTARIIRPS